MTTSFKKLYKLAEQMGSSNDEQYMPQPFGDDPEHKSTMDPMNPEPLGITQPKEDGNQVISSKESDEDYLERHVENVHGGYSMDEFLNAEEAHKYYHTPDDPDAYQYASHIHGPDGKAYKLTRLTESSKKTAGPRCKQCNSPMKTNHSTCSWGHENPPIDGEEPSGIDVQDLKTPPKNSSVKTADRSNTDESGSPGGVGAPKHVYNIDVEDPPEQQLFGDAGETSRGDGSIKMTSVTFNPETRKIVHAYVAENGEPKCSICEKYYTPKSIAEAKLAHCGHCPEDNPDANKIEEGDVVDGDVVKTASKKLSNDSELYTRGFLDHLHGKPLDEDLAVLSDDYFHGYDQARYYGKTPLESVGAKPHKVTQPAAPDNSLEGWESLGGQDYKYDIDRSQIIASTLPTNVLEAFFNTEE